MTAAQAGRFLSWARQRQELNAAQPPIEYPHWVVSRYERLPPSSDRDRGRAESTSSSGASWPGKRTLTQALQTQAVQRKARDDAAPGGDAAPVAEAGFSGKASEVPHRAKMEAAFGRSFAGVQAHVGAEASESSRALDAQAYTVGHRVAFRESNPDEKLVAHELTHVVQQGVGAAVMTKNLSEPGDALEKEADQVGDVVASGGRVAAGALGLGGSGAAATISRDKGGGAGGAASSYPWIGKITGTWSAALRKTSHKDADDPHKNTLADLQEGTEVQVEGKDHGWLKVRVSVDGKELVGYVSHELVAYVKPSAYKLPDTVVSAHVPTVREAFVILKRAQTQKVKGALKPSDDDQAQLDLAVTVLEKTRKYLVDHSTYEVRFVENSGSKVKIETIEDFILFVEAVETQYGSANPHAVVAEIRQLWYSDVNWELLVDSAGIEEGGKMVDIESEPDPIAQRFDMKDLAPAAGGKKLATSMGTVDIGHVMAGIDARLNGQPAAYPKARLKRTGHDSGESELKYDKLKEFSNGDSKAFTTWAGDLGQAYGEYLVEKYVSGVSGAKLKDHVKTAATDEELLGDIHGYIAVQVWKKVPASESPTGGEFKVSNILRDMYLVESSKKGDTYEQLFEQVSGQSGKDLKLHIYDQAISFATIWYAKKAYDAKGFWGSDGLDPASIMDNHIRDFSVYSDKNDATAPPEDKLQVLLDDFYSRLSGKLK